MSHFPKIACPICFKLEVMPCDENKGMPPCTCPAQGHGPCKTFLCLTCCDKAIANARSNTSFFPFPKRLAALPFVLLLIAGCVHRAPKLLCDTTPCGDVCCNDDGKLCPPCWEDTKWEDSE